MTRRVYIFDTTLRDGEQSPGVSLNVMEKLQIARQLARLGVDVIEAGFPITSPGDYEAVKTIAREVRGVTVAALARANFQDIDRAWEAVKGAEQPRIHTFIATSPIHMRHKLRMTEEQVIEAAVAAVKRARSYVSDVEFSAEDASRSELDFLCRVLEAAIAAGATVVNIPDTVGYATPEEFARFIRDIRQRVPGIEKVVLSVHCHDDLGLAVANSLAAVAAGANQVEGAINGIGERAGNAALEEVVMALYTRRDQFGCETNIRTEEIYRTSRLVSSLTGMPVQPNKAVVGKNAFAHESGIHQDGVLKERTTYEIMNPVMVGISQSNLVLGKHSGRHAFRQRLLELGYELGEEELNKAFQQFKVLADKKKEITDADLEAIVEEELRPVPVTYTLEYLHISTGTTIVPTATVGLKKGDEVFEEAACGNGPVDAICRAVDKVTGVPCVLKSWGINAVTSGKDAIGEVTLKISENGGKTYLGRGISTDILEASAKAYVNAVNRLLWESGRLTDKSNEVS
ncbi:2-isopropylmalate synthase [Desulfofundulus thermosubterraneus]|uniref:2-isopropylmalate synthase n=1 Tax=Desulfofundulus thermosubterraneus DSM 16057 TaxID=1121432 RepID=A0A1M6E579_9FIRM|nr:2-isopropylmalate synthase [Desulfofundulus thermosubterraneus]SHI80591.1 2-isopropylmalate synthase [Desulfofundulus thermosubterraneus DSM 16057]